MTQNKAIIKLFQKSGEVGPQPNLIKMLKIMFGKMTKAQFLQIFMDALMSVIITDAPIHCVSVNNMIKFAANGMAVISECNSVDGHGGLYVISQFLRMCRKYGSNNNKVIRWRFCLIFNHLLSYMSEGAVLPETLCEVATVVLLQRLKDKKPEIRAQAAHALHRLQIPDNANCKIVENFLFHMGSDPSVEVRTAIVKKIAMFPHVVDEMLKNTLIDISDNVRKEAYNRFLSYPFQSFSPAQRIIVLDKGLKDTSENIKSFVKRRLLDSWLDECDHDFVVFLEHLGVENDVICEQVLNVIFESYYDAQILGFINKILNVNTRTIDFGKLTVEKIFLWKCVAKYLTKEKKIELASHQGHFDDDFVDVLLPSLVHFIEYVNQYYFYFHTESDKEFILTQLLDMASTFEIDDFGLEALNKLCFDLMLHSQTSVKHIKPIVVLLNLTFKNSKDILNYVKDILNEIQSRTIEIHSLINQVGKKESLDHQKVAIKKEIEDLLEEDQMSDSTATNLLITKKNMIEGQCKNMILLPEELTQVDVAEKILLKGFELVFQVQQLNKVSNELSLLTDIIQNFVVGFLECSKINLRMEAIRSLAPYMIANNITAAKEHIFTLCAEIANPLSNRHLVLEIMFELFLRYDVKTFGMNDDLDIVEEECEDVFSVDDILPLLAKCFDYEVDDSSFKSVVVKGFCDLLIFKKVKSINVVSKLVILWFRRASYESYNIHNTLAKYFTTFVFYFRSSSSTLAKCYVPVLKEINENDLTTKLDFKVDELNSTLINLIAGLMYRSAKTAINAHGELAGYILDYLLEEDNPYSNMLVDTLFKLEIHYDRDNDLINLLGPKLLRVIKHFKTMNSDKTKRYLKKLTTKFDLVLQKKSSFLNQNIKGKVKVENPQEDPQVPSCNYQDPNNTKQTNISPSQKPPQESNDKVEIHSDLFSQEHDKLHMSLSSDDEDDEAHPQLEAVKRMSELLKKSFNTKIQDDTNLNDDDDY